MFLHLSSDCLWLIDLFTLFPFILSPLRHTFELYNYMYIKINYIPVGLPICLRTESSNLVVRMIGRQPRDRWLEYQLQQEEISRFLSTRSSKRTELHTLIALTNWRTSLSARWSSTLTSEQDVWAPGRLGTGACASEIHGVGQLSNVYAIRGTHYFLQSNFYLNSIIFI